jgi:hypothetical protein
MTFAAALGKSLSIGAAVGGGCALVASAFTTEESLAKRVGIGAMIVVVSLASCVPLRHFPLPLARAVPYSR